MAVKLTPRTSAVNAASQPAARHLKCERLEGRDLMAGIFFGNGIVTIEGTNARDIGVASYNGSNLVVSIAGGHSQMRTFSSSQVSQIVFKGFAGNDEFHNNTNHRSVAWGGDGDDYLKGGGNADTLYGDNGNDRVIGLDGNDALYGWYGNDLIEGGNGNDMLRGEYGDDSLWGHSGNDTLYGDDGNDSLYGGAGNDNVFGWNGNDRLFGEDGDDLMRGEEGNDTMYGGNGNDTMYAHNGNDTLYGEAGNDSLFGMNGADWLGGGDGNDYLEGGVDGSVDQLEGGRGADYFLIENYFSGNVRKRRDNVRDFNSSAGDRYGDKW